MIDTSTPEPGHLPDTGTDTIVAQNGEHGHEARTQLALAMTAASLLLVGALWGIVRPGARDVGQVLAGLASLIVAVPVGLSVWDSLRHPGLHGITDRLIGLAMLAAWATGDMVTAALLPTVMIFGHVLEERSLQSSQRAIRGLRKLSAGMAHRRVSDASYEDIDNRKLVPRDIVEVRVGERIPADGVVLAGRSNIDTSLLTGESMWTRVDSGHAVLGGAINMDGLLIIEVSRIGDEATLGQIIRLMHTAEQAKPPLTRLIERYAGVYMVMIVLIAALTWFASGSVAAMLAVLVASCPCALVIAAPAPAIAAVAVAARHGILIRGAAFLEELGELTSLVIDKTGTLTLGRLALVEIDAVESASADAALALAGALAAHSNHPVSRALAQRAHALPRPELREITEQQGLGLTAQSDSGRIVLGQQVLFDRLGIVAPMPPEHDGPVAGIAVDDQFVAWFRFADPCRDEAAKALAELRDLGLARQTLLTGDHARVAQRVAQQVGIHQVRAQVLPQDKLAAVVQERDAGYAALVVGDGVNDALALRAGAVGIAMGEHGTDVAMAAADIVLLGGDLRRLATCIRLSRRCQQTIQINGLIALAWTVLLVGAAAAGWLGPNGAIAAALLHNFGTLLVMANSARLLRFHEPLGENSRVRADMPGQGLTA